MVENVIDNAIGHNTDGGWISVTTGSDGRRRAWSSRTAGTSSTSSRSPSSPSRSGGSARTGPARTTAPASACRSSRRSPRRIGGTLDLQARPGGGLRVCVELPLATEAVPAGVPA